MIHLNSHLFLYTGDPSKLLRQFTQWSLRCVLGAKIDPHRIHIVMTMQRTKLKTGFIKSLFCFKLVFHKYNALSDLLAKTYFFFYLK